MESIKIILFCIIAAVSYGIIHDEITAHICVEYFTVAHPPIFHTNSPLILGFAWGITATWWVALLLGCILAFVARSGTAPKIPVGSVISQVILVLSVTAISAAAVGMAAYLLTGSNQLFLPDYAVPRSKHVAFFGVWAAHLTSYTVGICGGLATILNVWRTRTRLVQT
jgi:hypothetical protein